MARLVLGREPTVLVLRFRARLALAVQRVDVLDPDPEGLLHGVADVDLGGVGGDHEDVGAVLHEGVGLLRHDGTHQDLLGVLHDALPSAPSVPSPSASAVFGARLGGGLAWWLRGGGVGLAWRRPWPAGAGGLLGRGGLGRRGGGLPRQRGVGEDDPVALDHVVGVELGALDGLDGAQVGEGPVGDAVLGGEHDEHAPLEAERGEGGHGVLGARGRERPLVDDRHLALGGAVREGGVQGEADHLLRGALVVRPGLRTEGHATARPLRGTDRSLASPARPLLTEGLGAAAADLGPGAGRLGAGPGRGQLGRDDLVEHGRVGLDPEDLGIQCHGVEHGAVDGAALHGAVLGGGALAAALRGLGHGAHGGAGHAGLPPLVPLTVLRRTTMPPRGPGTAPVRG